MEPEKVNSNKFKVEDIIYNNGDFSIAYGLFVDGGNCIAMRWNGVDSNMGFPKSSGKPTWFVVHNKLKIEFLKSLLQSEFSENQKIIQILKNEI